MLFDDLDAHVLGRCPLPTDTTNANPHRSVDARGRALPMTDDEIRGRAEMIARNLDALDDMGDEEEQRRTLEALMAGLDEDRMSYRPRSE